MLTVPPAAANRSGKRPIRGFAAIPENPSEPPGGFRQGLIEAEQEDSLFFIP